MENSPYHDLIILQKKLHKIAEARRLNAKMQEHLKRRLLVIESKLFTLTTKKNKLESFYYDPPKIWGFSYREYSKLSQIFWGRLYKKADDHASYNKTYKTYYSLNDKRLLFMNQHRSPKQEALLITKDNKFPVAFSKQLPILPPISFKPYSIHDVVRFYIFTKLFGKSFPISSLYPHISSIVMKSRLKELKNICDPPEFESLGINPEELQDFITNVLNNL